MKKTNNGNIILALLTSLLALIGICVLFADGFGDTAGGVWGTGFEVIFGKATFGDKDAGTVFCAGLFIAFLCDCLVFLLPFLTFFLGKGQKTMLYLFIGVIGIIGATLVLFAKPFFVISNTGSVFKAGAALGTEIEDSLTLGTAFITNSVFMYIAGALGLIGAYLGHKKDSED